MQSNILSAIPAPLLNWYHQNSRPLPWRDPIVPYHTWISEIMCQQTRIDAAIGYYHRFLDALPSIAALADAPEQQLLKLWEGLGYYNRARNLQKAAQILVRNYGGELPADYEQLQALPGIGRYTAGAIASIAFSIPVPAVDGNVLRVLSRVLNSTENVSRPQTKKQFEEALTALLQTEPAKSAVGDFNQALMELGALVCIPNGAPKCLTCPLQPLCQGYANGTAESLPVKDEKKARKVQKKTVFVLQCGDHFALHKRADTGLLASLWEFPNLDGTISKASVPAALQSWRLTAQKIERLGKAKHIFSHIEWNMTGFLVQVEQTAPVKDWVWVSRAQLQKDYPLPSAFDAFKRTVETHFTG